MEELRMKQQVIVTNDIIKKAVIGLRVPKDFFISSGVGESDITVHAGSYHLALRDAGIEQCNIMVYSSTLSAIAHEIPKGSVQLQHGAVLETIMACSNSQDGERATAGIIYAWLIEKNTGKKHGGFVCEYSGHDEEDHARETLRRSLKELYTNGYEEDYELTEPRFIIRSLVPKKRFGTAMVVMCFVNHEIPVLEMPEAA